MRPDQQRASPWWMLASCSLLLASSPSFAQDPLPPADLVGPSPRSLLPVPGAATVLDEEVLERTEPLSVSEALRKVPGVYLAPEDPLGLGMDVGICGLDPHRSRQLTVLEDGAPLALAPYGAPQLEYAPPVERIERLEVIKGVGAILYGAQTLGGVIHLVTLPPPPRLTLSVRARVGTPEGLRLQGEVGDTVGPLGYLAALGHRRQEGPRQEGLRSTDAMGKLGLRLGPEAALQLKLEAYDESSRLSSTGLTEAQYQADPWLHPAGLHDRTGMRRFAGHVRLDHALGRWGQGWNWTRGWRGSTARWG